jgi:hypothetical protein
MISVDFTDQEFAALYAACTNAERIDWEAYDRARARIVERGRTLQPPTERIAPNEIAVDARGTGSAV